MKVKFSNMTKMIAQAVAAALVPTIRSIVKEEVTKGTRRVIKENRNSIAGLNEQAIQYTHEIANDNPLEESSVASAKTELAKRAHSRAEKILTNSFAEDDPYADLIMDAEDPQLEEEKKARKFDNLPMVEVSEPLAAGVQPEQIDYSAMMSKMNL
jgi:hypothetical protein|tara:strand:+ start:3422 stop:3886 length:465 start_codon:yes stop_codon:yes gene_type:complete